MCVKQYAYNDIVTAHAKSKIIFRARKSSIEIGMSCSRIVSVALAMDHESLVAWPRSGPNISWHVQCYHYVIG